MRFAYVSTPDLPIQVERRRRPELRGQPLVVLSGLVERDADQPWASGGRQLVVAASDEATQMGVASGQTRRQAEHLCPGAALVGADPAAYQAACAALVAALRGCSPTVRAEPAAWGVELEVSGLELLFGPDPVLAAELGRRAARVGLRARVGLGPNRLVAALAARVAEPGGAVVVAPSGARAFLEPLAVARLPLGEESRERLELLGVRTFGQLLALPRAGLARQVGSDALALARAADATGELLVPERSEAWLRAELELEWALETREQLSQVAQPLIARLVARLRWRYLGARLVRLRLRWPAGGRSERQTRLPTATQSPQVLLEALLELAAGLRDDDAASPTGLAVELGELGPLRGRQVGLFEGQRLRRTQAARAVEELAGKFKGRLQAPSFEKRGERGRRA